MSNFLFPGDAGLKEYTDRPARSKDKDKASASNRLAHLRERFRVYFPSHETVVNSRGGQKVSRLASRILDAHRSFRVLRTDGHSLLGPYAFCLDGGTNQHSLERCCVTANPQGKAPSCTTSFCTSDGGVQKIRLHQAALFTSEVPILQRAPGKCLQHNSPPPRAPKLT